MLVFVMDHIILCVHVHMYIANLLLCVVLVCFSVVLCCLVLSFYLISWCVMYIADLHEHKPHLTVILLLDTYVCMSDKEKV